MCQGVFSILFEDLNKRPAEFIRGACRRFDHKVATLTRDFCAENRGESDAKEQHSEDEPRSVRASSPLAFLSTLTKSASSYQARFTRTSPLGGGRARADGGSTRGTFCLVSGDFPLGGEEKPGSLHVAQIASRPNARMCQRRRVFM